MANNTLGSIKLSPIKEEGNFVFMATDLRINNKLSKGDYIKIFVPAYSQQGGKHLISASDKIKSKMVVKGLPLVQEHEASFGSVEDLFEALCGMYRNQYYFGKVTQ